MSSFGEEVIPSVEQQLRNSHRLCSSRSCRHDLELVYLKVTNKKCSFPPFYFLKHSKYVTRVALLRQSDGVLNHGSRFHATDSHRGYYTTTSRSGLDMILTTARCLRIRIRSPSCSRCIRCELLKRSRRRDHRRLDERSQHDSQRSVQIRANLLRYQLEH